MYEDLTNIIPFNPSLNDAMSDSDYERDESRINGLTDVTAQASLHNKLFSQCSSVAYAIAQFIASKGFEAFDYDIAALSDNFKKALIAVIEESTNKLVPDTRTPNHEYSKGDIVHDPNIPLWGELECILEGTTSNGTLSNVRINSIGQLIKDGTVVWALRTAGLSIPIGIPTPFTGSFITVTLEDEGIKYYVPIHQEIGLPMDDCRLCDGQDLSNFGLLGNAADMRSRCIRGAVEYPDKETGETITKGDSTAFNTYEGKDSLFLSKSNLPTEQIELSVPLTFSSAGSHTHSYIGIKPYSSYPVIPIATTVVRTYDKLEATNTNTGIAGGHMHSGNVSGSFKMNDTQSPISLIHPYYSVSYIQRIY